MPVTKNCQECGSTDIIQMFDEQTGEELWRCKADSCINVWEDDMAKHPPFHKKKKGKK